MTVPAGNDDQVLIERALAGDESALAALFDGYRDRHATDALVEAAKAVK